MFPTLMALPIYLTSAEPFEWSTANIACMSLYVTGSFIATWSELQRKWFKQDPNNKGKLYTHGLFRISRHPNCFGDLLLTSGWWGFTGNYSATAIMAGIQLLNFCNTVIPEMTGKSSNI
mmetsp:Transcript_7411/g.11556  ORF Transcript_7411/g.11556 Transcript_7411/m.11556 type:complete len:119 (+) Transcript_7411:2-358(+)